MLRLFATVLVVVLLAGPSSLAVAGEGTMDRCMRHESATERLECLDATAAALNEEEADPALLACTEEADQLRRLDCFVSVLGQEAREEEPASEGRLGVDFNLPSDYQPAGGYSNCTEAEAQARRAEERLRGGGIAAGLGGAMTAAAVVLGAIAISTAKPDKETGALPGLDTVEDVDRFLGLTVGAGILGAGGGIAFGAADTQFRMSWVHGQLAEMEGRRCGGAVTSIERR